MNDKGKAGAKFAVDIRQLSPRQRTDPAHRRAVAARKRVLQAKYVMDQEEAALKLRAARLEAARLEFEAAGAAALEAEAAVAEPAAE